jgi:hypothetical protein
MDALSAQIEIWKKIIDVQQHFNDIELRIRNFAIIVTGAFLGLGSYAIKDGGFIKLCGINIPSAAMIICSSLLPLFAFYLMDRLWYHRLLDGAVKAGIEAEQTLKQLNVTVGLGSQISAASPFILWLFGIKVHSRHKMDGFYGIIALAIITLTVTLALAIRPTLVSPGPVSANNAIHQALDDSTARAICDAYSKNLLSQSVGVPGAIAIDPQSGAQAVFISGQWKLVPKC